MERYSDSDRGEYQHSGFKHILPFLAIPVAFAVMHGMRRRMHGRMAGWHREEWKNGVPPMFAELHRRAHAAEAEKAAENQQPAVSS